MNRPELLCLEAAVGFPDLPAFIFYTHFFFYCSSGVRNGKTKKTYSYAFCLFIVNELGCTIRDSVAEYHIGAQLGRRKHTLPRTNLEKHHCT